MCLVSFNMSLGSAFLLIWVVIHIPFSTACLKAERNYLLDVKAGLNISSGRFSSWRGFNCCEWEGVACDHHTSHVISLDLSYEDSGVLALSEIRPSLFDLQHLQHLDLSGNDFQGISIPPHFSKLQRLTFLSLSHAGFCGEVPLELGNMSSLRHLDISSYLDICIRLDISRFDVWVRKLRSLEFLGMSGVNLSMVSENSWGEALSGLANLNYVDLSYSQLSGKIPDLSNLTHLSHLNLGRNSFLFELPSWFENASSLVSLNLRSCDLKGSIPYNFMAHSRLKYLDLGRNNDLKGDPSFMLSHSSSLVVLYINNCNLGGTLGLSMKNLSKLEHMDLSYNNLEGSIPTSIGSLSSLRNLELHHNRLSGHIPSSLSQIIGLNILSLENNQLSGTIPDSISNMVGLEILFLSSNRLTANFLLQRLENMSRLEALYLSENQLVVNISTTWVPQFSQLEFLELRSCNIEGDVPSFLSQQYELVELDLSDNNMAGNIPSWLWDLSLVSLNLSNNQLEGFLPHKISYLEMMDLHGNRLYGTLPVFDFGGDVLDLSDNEFNGSIPITMGTPRTLLLSGNNLTGKIPSFICTPDSDILDLSRNKLIGDIPANIGGCSSLLVLKLAQNCLEGEIPKELGNLMGLITLNVNGNRLQGIIPPSLANCTQLHVFDLGNNKFEGNIPIWIENLTDLRILSLASNKFTDRIPPQLFRMQSLQILDLSHNQLSGNIPSDVSKLHAMMNISQSFDVQSIDFLCSPNFSRRNCAFKFADEVTVWIKGRETPYQKIIGADKFIDLSGNKLSGNIPPEFGLLKGLISLNISKNNLTGPIPDSLGAMGYLESLDLSGNKLSGKIPSQLLNLTFLAVLNLSDNMLVGLIPQEKQFSTFESSSFLGNPNLHGPPLENRTRSLGPGGMENHNSTIDKDEDADADTMDRWWAVAVGLSYGVGFATVITILCFHLNWRYKCFSHMDNFIYYLLE